jgi:gliding motility-associated lipoprotein GldD
MRVLIFIFFLVLLNSCNDEVYIKPSAELRLEYPKAEYILLETGCPYEFMSNKVTLIKQKRNCGINIYYPKMKATLYLTYLKVNNGENIDSLLYDAQKLTYDHTVKAASIFEQPRVDSINNVYGMFYMINGNAATQSQFYVTDKVNHFLTGALYFETKPNFDSLYPAVVYLRNDVKKIMETITWK